MARRPQLPLPGIGPMEIEIPEMDWEQIGGDMDPASYGGTIASGDGYTVELIKIQPVREYVGDEEAKDVGFPFWTRVASFTIDDLDPGKKEVRNAMKTVGLDENTLENLSPDRRAIAIADALLDYGHADEGPAGWSSDIDIPEKVKWWNGVGGSEYLADEDEAFRNEVLGYGEIKQAIEEAVERMADESSAQGWSTPGDQTRSDIEDAGYDPDSIVSIAEFGEAVAVNGELTDETMSAVEAKLEAEGYEFTNFGGRIPSDEGYAHANHVVDAVVHDLNREREDVVRAAESFDWWQDEIPWGTSGYGSVWAKKRRGAEEHRHTRRK